MTLQGRIQFRRNGFTLDVDLAVESGETLAVVGPNGAGKTTLLRILAGLEEAASGSITMGSDTWMSERGMRPPEERNLGVVFQDSLLFPHLSLRQNVAFGAKSPEAVEKWIRLMQLEELAPRQAAEISGGEATRAAVARALVREPQLLLLDEPMAEVEAASAPALRRLLQQAAAESGATTVLVTHSIVDAAALADRILVLEDGQVTRKELEWI